MHDNCYSTILKIIKDAVNNKHQVPITCKMVDGQNWKFSMFGADKNTNWQDTTQILKNGKKKGRE